MYPKPIQDLIEIFSEFPGIGPRQAARFAFYLLRKGNMMTERLSNALTAINSVTLCAQCFRSIEKNKETTLCSFCSNPKRNQELIAVVEKEWDIQNLERSGIYSGLYHVLGGTISLLDADSPKKLRLRYLFDHVKKICETYGSAEVILATSTTTEGDTTALYIEQILTPLKNHYPKLVVTRLGRGLSLGAELEYADEITLKNAFTNRR